MDPVNDKAIVQVSYKHHTHVLLAAKSPVSQMIYGSDHSGSQVLMNGSHQRQTTALAILVCSPIVSNDGYQINL